MAHLLDHLGLDIGEGVNETFNSCDKEVYAISPLEQLKRFMLLGTEGGTYYIHSKKLTEINVNALETLLHDSAASHQDVLTLIDAFVTKAYKKENLIYVLARCCCHQKDTVLREAAYTLLNKVCVTPTHLFLFLEMYEHLSRKYYNSTGWNKMHKTHIAHWYLRKSLPELAYHVTKYKNRNKWTHRDVLRLAHITPDNEIRNSIFKYIVKGELPTTSDDDTLNYLIGAEYLLRCQDTEVAIALIRKWKFVREHLSTKLQKDPDVMNVLVEGMPLVALLRTLNRLTSIGVFDRYPGTYEMVCNRLNNVDYIRKSKVHPIQFLIASKMYANGKGDKGSLVWSPKDALVESIDNAFYSSFVNVQATGKRTLVALDVSSSMLSATVCGVSCLMAAEVSTAMAMVLKKIEGDKCDIMGFSHTFKPLDIYPEMPLRENLRKVYSLSFGSTDLSLPMKWAMDNQRVYDTIIIFTDCETNSNSERPSQVLKKYRQWSCNTSCKFIVVAMASNSFSIADPTDKDMLDIAGFDAETPLIINEFSIM